MTERLSTIEIEISSHQNQIAELREAGARAAADQSMSGAELMKWLKQRGMGDTAARNLCVEIIHERRKARAASTEPEATR